MVYRRTMQNITNVLIMKDVDKIAPATYRQSSAMVEGAYKRKGVATRQIDPHAIWKQNACFFAAIYCSAYHKSCGCSMYT